MKLLPNLFLSALLALSLLLVTGCQTTTGPTVNTVAGRGLRTFAVLEADGLKGVYRNLDLLRGVTKDITAQLTAHGYAPADPAQADFLVLPKWDISYGGVVSIPGEFIGDRTIVAVNDVELAVTAKLRASGQVIWDYSVWIRASREQATTKVRHELVAELLAPFPTYVAPQR